MGNDWKRTFKSALSRGVIQLGYTMNSDTIFARVMAKGVFGCVGYLTSANSVSPFVGVYFEQVEQIFEEIFEPLRAIPKTTSRYFPTPCRGISQLKQDRSGIIEKDYLRIERDRVADVARLILTDFEEFGVEYIESNLSLAGAADTMANGRGGGMGSVATRLPIIYWMLGRTSEAKSYMADIAAKKYPIGDYERYAAILTARIDSASGAA